ncbi:hypothetical protein NQ176_g11118 [Zarea fungicola]|uniref:Uncharacterized protein n=1 Tax=Zarea fungicola TaxID=93591 RepID=A0ACC1MD14_9HYPO|nr:hypothetical protein NQ176_g11118 [Lecanicillium fungicola]
MEAMMPAPTHMQGNMQVPDELLALFSRNLTFNPELQAAMDNEQAQQQLLLEQQQQHQQLLLQQQQQQEQEAAAARQPSYSASQHYTHSDPHPYHSKTTLLRQKPYFAVTASKPRS